MRYKLFFTAFTLTAAFILLNGNRVQAQGPFNIGTINPGDSILIIYSVTVDNPLPPSVTQISNQGIISGSNFSNLSTDDPDYRSGGATITMLNMFALPVTFGSFRAYEKNTIIELAWRILTEINTDRYEVEKSANGRSFQKIGEVMATGSNGAVLDYTFPDNNPSTDNFYRLRVVDKDGQFKYSATVRVKTGSSNQELTIYPNPVRGKEVNVQMTRLNKGRYEFALYNAGGQIVFRQYIDHAGGSAAEVIQLPASLSSGLYHAVLKKNDITFTRSLIMY